VRVADTLSGPGESGGVASLLLAPDLVGVEDTLSWPEVGVLSVALLSLSRLYLHNNLANVEPMDVALLSLSRLYLHNNLSNVEPMD
jgi:hypothetical protein